MNERLRCNSFHWAALALILVPLAGCASPPSRPWIHVVAVSDIPELAPLPETSSVVLYVLDAAGEVLDLSEPVQRGGEVPGNEEIVIIKIYHNREFDLRDALVDARRIALHNGCNALVLSEPPILLPDTHSLKLTGVLTSESTGSGN